MTDNPSVRYPPSDGVARVTVDRRAAITPRSWSPRGRLIRYPWVRATGPSVTEDTGADTIADAAPHCRTVDRRAA